MGCVSWPWKAEPLEEPHKRYTLVKRHPAKYGPPHWNPLGLDKRGSDESFFR